MRRTRMKKLALLLSLLALGALGLVACGGGGDDQTTAASETKTTRDELAADKRRARGTPTDWSQFYPADNKSCGYFDRYRFAVVEGDVSCRVAWSVMRANLSVARTMPGSWSCGGSDSGGSCVNGAGEVIQSWVTCHNRSPCPGWIKRSVAQRRDRRAKVSADTTTEAKLSTEQVLELKREANEWARDFSRGGVCDQYMGQPICVRLSGSGPGAGVHAPRVSAAFQKSFADATVDDIKSVRTVQVGWSDHPVSYAAVKFSNGEVVVFNGGGEWYSCAGPGSGCSWSIADEDHNRRFLEAAGVRE
jgi:hypothetical protein